VRGSVIRLFINNVWRRLDFAAVGMVFRQSHIWYSKYEVDIVLVSELHNGVYVVNQIRLADKSFRRVCEEYDTWLHDCPASQAHSQHMWVLLFKVRISRKNPE
jgi:hypothetical protein